MSNRGGLRAAGASEGAASGSPSREHLLTALSPPVYPPPPPAQTPPPPADDFFGDFVTVAILVIVHQGLGLTAAIFQAMADQAGLWDLPTLAGTTSDEIAAKLAVGEGSAADLEQERMELAALNNDAFRNRFLERNRPWLARTREEPRPPATHPPSPLAHSIIHYAN